MEWNADRKITKEQLGTEIFEISLAAFVASFLHGVSDSTIEMAISAGLNTFGKLKEASVTELIQRCGFKESTAILVKYGILEHEKEMKACIASGNIRLIMSLSDNAPSMSLNGISFCFTGSLENMTRAEAKEKVRILGGVTLHTVKPGLSFLVTNNAESSSSKSRAAQDLGIARINEDEFSDIINNPSKAEFYFNHALSPDLEQKKKKDETILEAVKKALEE
jgi:DNA ligase (NAD+)